MQKERGVYELCRRYYQAAQERRISQKELAEDLNVSCATVNRWENGRTVPNKMTMFVIREYCKRHGVAFAYDEEQKRGDAG